MVGTQECKHARTCTHTRTRTRTHTYTHTPHTHTRGTHSLGNTFRRFATLTLRLVAVTCSVPGVLVCFSRRITSLRVLQPLESPSWEAAAAGERVATRLRRRAAVQPAAASQRRCSHHRVVPCLSYSDAHTVLIRDLERGRWRQVGASQDARLNFARQLVRAYCPEVLVASVATAFNVEDRLQELRDSVGVLPLLPPKDAALQRLLTTETVCCVRLVAESRLPCATPRCAAYTTRCLVLVLFCCTQWRALGARCATLVRHPVLQR
jgi:hypothetical protein